MPSTPYKILAILSAFYLVFPLKTLAEEPPPGSKIKTEIKTYYIHQDHLGGTSVVTDENGNIVQTLDYYPYGESRIDEQTGDFESSKKFTGQEEDPESGLYYFNARYYDPSIGRFLSPDPAAFNQPEKFLADPQQLNLYSYSRNNPLRFIDPFGLSTATTNPVPEGGWTLDQVMAEFNGVAAKYNGRPGNPREEASCVNYAKRYLSKAYGVSANDIRSVGNARNMWNTIEDINNNLKAAGSSYAFSQYYNGEGFNLPGEGDLLFWTEGKYGHVMVVTESNFNNETGKGYVEIIDQNASDKAVRTYDVTRADSGYSIMKKDKTPMAGWFSLNDNSAPVNIPNNNLPNSAPAPIPQQAQLSFSQRIWNSAKQFFKNLF